MQHRILMRVSFDESEQKEVSRAILLLPLKKLSQITLHIIGAVGMWDPPKPLKKFRPTRYLVATLFYALDFALPYESIEPNISKLRQLFIKTTNEKITSDVIFLNSKE